MSEYNSSADTVNCQLSAATILVPCCNDTFWVLTFDAQHSFYGTRQILWEGVMKYFQFLLITFFLAFVGVSCSENIVRNALQGAENC